MLLAYSGSGETESTVCVGACCVQDVRPSRRAAASSQTSGRLMAGDRQHLQRQARPDETRYNIPSYYNISVRTVIAKQGRSTSSKIFKRPFVLGLA